MSRLLLPDFPLSVWPHLFRSAGHEKRRREQLKWSVAFRLYIGSFPCAQLTRTRRSADADKPRDAFRGQ